MSKATDSAKEFLAGVFAKLPAEKRAQVEEVLLSADAEAALTIVGEGVLGRAENTRIAQELQQKEQTVNTFKQELDQWYAANEPKLKEFDQIKPEFDRLKAGDTIRVKPNGEGSMNEKQVQDLIAAATADAVPAMALMTELSVDHFQKFGEKVDMRAMLADPKLGKPQSNGSIYGLVDAYQTKYGEKLTAKATEAENARVEKIVSERLQAKLAANPQIPYPVRPGGSPLDLIEEGKDPASLHTVDTATAEYERLQASRG
jgi:hypothetical protein